MHAPASWLTKKLYAEALAKKPKRGETNWVLFTAGGTGAGKSSALRSMGSLADKAQIIFDTNMNGFDSALKKVNQALAAGKKVDIAYTFRDPVEALKEGALPRAMRQEEKYGSGRTVPIDEAHRHARGTPGTLWTAWLLISRAIRESRSGRSTTATGAIMRGLSRFPPFQSSMKRLILHYVKEPSKPSMKSGPPAGSPNPSTAGSEGKLPSYMVPGKPADPNWEPDPLGQELAESLNRSVRERVPTL